MKFIQIRKKSENTWLHISDTGSFLISKFYFKLDNNTFQITERGGVKRHIYQISEITVFDDTNGGNAEFFTNQVQLYERLLFLRYSGFENINGGGGSGELISKFTSNPIPTIVDTDILIPANETWLIDSVHYTNSTASTIPFSYAPDGLLYFLTVVATKLNTFIGKFGTASTDPSEPVVNNDELFLTTYLISDGTATVIIPPVTSNIYVEKEIYQPQITIGSAPVGAIAMGKKSALVVAGTIPSIEFIVKNNPNDYFIGAPFYTINKTPNPVKFPHLSSDVAGNPGSISWFHPELRDYYAAPNELTAWNLDIVDGQKIHRRATTYIDTDNVLFRSGTKVGKPITGDLAFSQTKGLKTNEVAGIQSYFFVRDGKWLLQIIDGIDEHIFEFTPTKGLIATTLFDKESDNLAFAQMGDVLPLADRIFDLELVVDNKADLVGGLVPSSQLPAYVDDVLEFANLASFPVTGEVGKIYVALDSNKQYRWSGSSYIQITNGLIASTNDVPEGSNLYFTTARVLAALLSGISFATGGAIVSTDSVLVAFGKIQKQINDFGTALGLKQDNLTDTNFGTFTNSVATKNTQADTDVLAYVDITTGKWVKQTFSKLVDYFKGFFIDLTSNQTIAGVKTFTGSVVVPDATANNQPASLGQLLKPQIEVSGNQTAVSAWNGKEITFTANGILTVQGTLPEQFNFALRADNCTITWAITAPLTWRVDGLTVGTAPPTMANGQIAYVSRRLNTNEIRVSGL